MKRNRNDDPTLDTIMGVQDLQQTILHFLNPRERVPLRETNKALSKNVSVLQSGETVRPEIRYQNMWKYRNASNQDNVSPALIRCNNKHEVEWALSTYKEISVLELPEYINISTISPDLWGKVRMLDVSYSSDIVCDINVILEKITFVKISERVKWNGQKWQDINLKQSEWKNQKPFIVRGHAEFSEDGINMTDFFQKLSPYIHSVKSILRATENVCRLLLQTDFLIDTLSFNTFRITNDFIYTFLTTQHSRLKNLLLSEYRGTLDLPIHLESLVLSNCSLTFDDANIRINHLKSDETSAVVFAQQVDIHEWTVEQIESYHRRLVEINLAQINLSILRLNNVKNANVTNYKPQIKIYWENDRKIGLFDLSVRGEIEDCKILLNQELLNVKQKTDDWNTELTIKPYTNRIELQHSAGTKKLP